MRLNNRLDKLYEMLIDCDVAIHELNRDIDNMYLSHDPKKEQEVEKRSIEVKSIDAEFQRIMRIADNWKDLELE